MNTTDANAVDSALWLAVRQDDKTAFRILFDKYGGAMLQSANALLKDNEASETVVHDIFLNLWIKRETLEILHFRSYVITATRYHVYKILKSRKALRETPGYEGQLEAHAALAVNGGEERMAEQTLREMLQQHMNGLPKRCGEIFLMSREQQLSNQEIADRLNISKRSVENQITHALQHLRVHLKEYSLVALLIFER